MKIKSKEVVIYVLKVYKNVIFLVAYNTEKDSYVHFEISSKYNEVDKIIKMFRNPSYFFVGYGNKHYDNIFINYLIKKRDHIFQFSSSNFIKTFYEVFLDNIKNRNWTEDMIELKYAQNFDYIDLEMVLSDKFSRRSIYEQCFHDGILQNVEIEDDDYVAFDSFDYEVDSIKQKCDTISKILSKNKDKIDVRIQVYNKYKSDVLDNNDSSALNTILLDKYQEKNNVKYENLTKQDNHIYSSQIFDLISNDIKFDTDEFNEFFSALKPMLYSSMNPIIRRFVTYGNSNVLFATNGVECESNLNIFKSTNNEKIYMIHVNSLDASVCLRYGIYPSKLVETHENMVLFNNMFDNFLVNALKSPINSNCRNLFTRGLDEIVSRYNSKQSWLYDPSRFAKIKVNSNLILMMLIEQLLIYGANLILIEDNTIVFSSYIDMRDVIDKWNKQFGLSYSYVECKKFFKYSVYDYAALDINNKIVSNGMFKENEINTLASSIVAKAVENNILFNTDISDTVVNGKLRDFIMFHKVSGNKRFMFKGVPIGNEVAFYATSQPLPTLYVEENLAANGRYSRFEPVIRNVNLCVLEKYMLDPTKDTKFNISYEYYINKAKSIIEEIKTEQMIIEIPTEKENEKASDDKKDN